MLIKVKIRDDGEPRTYALPEGIVPNPGDMVVFESEWGPTWGIAVGTPFAPPKSVSCCQKARGEISRLAGNHDLESVRRMTEREREVLEFCRERAAELQLEMKVLTVEGVVGSNNLTCFFTADNRVDFRQLVRDIGGRFKCHVLMRQINGREEARRSCGVGPCGRTLCCASFLNGPLGVSSKTARDAAPGVSHSKLTGVCGKLMCCLGYESAEPEQAPVSIH
ncbi:MAG: regulatory iron-sulfur-containing complex subunit RicT [Nitrospirota bacterium]|nr:regulatory iron-sulfur-containing complex subunit RicT [Nitrospirota bacterium]